MTKKKLIRFTENRSFPHLFQPTYQELQHAFPLKGNWHQDFFNNQNPITLELGCGKGEYTIALAKRHPERNFIGIDIKGARLWRGCKTVAEDDMANVAFIRTRIDHLENLFSTHEISEIWITFPDPHPSKERKRLTSPMFLSRYEKIMQPGGIIHLKTDNPELFEYTLETVPQSGGNILVSDPDVYRSPRKDAAGQIQTFYENMWLEEGRTIFYTQFTLKNTGDQNP